MHHTFAESFARKSLIEQAIRAGAAEYVACLRSHRNSQPGPMNGDGFAWHNSFIRGKSAVYARHGRKNSVRWSSENRELESIHIAGDYLFYAPQKGQNRFLARFDATRYCIIATSGVVTGNVLTLSSMGTQRQEFFLNQNDQIPQNPDWTLRHRLGLPSQRGQIPLLNSGEIRVAIALKVYGAQKERIRCHTVVPDGQINVQACEVCLADSHLLFDESVDELLTSIPRMRRTAKASNFGAPVPIDLQVKRKQSPPKESPDQGTG